MTLSHNRDDNSQAHFSDIRNTSPMRLGRKSTDIREDIYDRSVRKKEQEKIRYNKGVKIQYFALSDFVLLRDSTPHLRKPKERWRRLFIIDGFCGNHWASYVLKTLDGKPTPNIHHSDHLRIFRPREGYLRSADEITRNLRFRRKKD